MLGVKPSYSTGFAQWPGMSEHPQLWKGLAVAYAPYLGQTGDKLIDWSGNNRNGTFAAGAASPSWTSDKFGSVLSFDGGDYVNCGNIQTDFDGITVVVGVKFNDVSWGLDPNGLSIVEKGYDGSTLPLRLAGQDGNLRWGFYNGDWNNLVSHAEGNFSIGVPYQIAGTINSADMVLYVDGVQVANLGSAPDSLITNAKNLLIGAYDKDGALQNYHNGLIYYAMIWNRGLIAAEIALHHQIMKQLAI